MSTAPIPSSAGTSKTQVTASESPRAPFYTHPLWECAPRLVRVAQGFEPADLVVRDCRLVDVCTREVLEHTDIAVADGRVAYLGVASHTAEHCIGAETQVIDAAGAYVAPGFLDGHIHVESAMVGPAEYARAVVPHGTVGIYYDPHEICNVAGLDGVRQMAADADRVPLKCMLNTPSCVPAVPGFEDTGSSVDAAQIAESMTWPFVVGLGEMMNYPGILAGAGNPVAEVAATLRAGKTVTGHYSTPEMDRDLNAYIASGVSSCHESTRAEDLLAKVRLGMYGQIRQGSAWHNLHDLAHAVAGGRIDTRLCNLVTDDCHPDTLVTQGHLDHLLRLAVAEGIDALEAIQMVTINTATCFKMQDDLGSVTPGKCADLVFLEDLKDFRVLRTVIDGRVVAEGGAALFNPGPFAWPDWMTHSMNLGEKITEDTFRVYATADGTQGGIPLDLPEGATRARVRAIRVRGGDTIAREEHVEVPVHDGRLLADSASDTLKAFVFERHHATGRHAAGFVRGLGIHGALAQTVAHDAHNLLVVGDNDADMALAANTLVECGGGVVAVVDGRVLACVELPVGGLMSAGPVEEVAAQVARVEAAWEQMGCAMPLPFMTLGLLSLACIPELRLTNRGYVDCTTFSFVPLAE